jgi:hypothetical protein
VLYQYFGITFVKIFTAESTLLVTQFFITSTSVVITSPSFSMLDKTSAAFSIFSGVFNE